MLNLIFIHSLWPSTTRYQTGTQFHALTSPERGSSRLLTIYCSNFSGMTPIFASFHPAGRMTMFGGIVWPSLTFFKRTRPPRLNGSWVSLIWSIATTKESCKSCITLSHVSAHPHLKRSRAFLAISSHDAFPRAHSSDHSSFFRPALVAQELLALGGDFIAILVFFTLGGDFIAVDVCRRFHRKGSFVKG